MTQLKVFADKQTLITAATEHVVRTIADALARRSQVFIALSGGSTPKPLYEQLAQAAQLDWKRIHVCFVDERNVGPDDKESNFRMIRAAMLSHIAIPEQNVHRMRGELPAEQAAADYERELRALTIPLADESPVFDFMLLGMGPDGHTASLFPDTAALQERQRWVTANHVPKLNTVRITLSYPVINRSRSLAFLVSGDDKAQPLAEILSGKSSLPAAGIAPVAGELIWFADQAAAALVS